MMKIPLRITSLLVVLFSWSASVWAQPANDKCSGAIQLPIYNSEASAVKVSGDTRNVTDGALDGIPVCSANFFRDDVWYYVTTPAVASESGYSIKVYFNESPTDIPNFGMALYNSCDAVAGNAPFFCGSQDDVFWWDDYGLGCFGPNETVYIRVWSAAGDATDWTAGEGTFRIAVFPREDIHDDEAKVLWGDQPGEGDFAGGINDWTLEGISCTGTPAENALWTWDDSGFPQYIFASNQTSRIKSRTLCNGVMVFESTFLDIGPNQVAGSGTCPQDHEGALTSPVIDLSGFDSPGVSLLFNQSMQRYVGGEHWIDYSIDGGTIWKSIQINTEKTYLSTNVSTGTGYYNEEYRVALPGAEKAANFRVRFRFKGGAYWWIIDDVRIIERECSNTSLAGRDEPFFAIAPWVKIPANQVFPFGALSDVFNAGACTQTSVVLNHTVEDLNTNEIVYNENLDYGSLAADSLAQNILFPNLIVLPKKETTYRGTYTLVQDSVDFNPANNLVSFEYSVGGDTFALEDGATREVSFNKTLYTVGAPPSLTYGNYFRPVVDATVKTIQWGVSNPDSLAGKSVTVYLLQWTDTNGDHVAESSERRYIGLKEYTFTGLEDPNVLINTTLDNFISPNPTDPIVMKGGLGYMAMVEYSAAAGDPQIFFLASEERDFTAQQLAMDTAYAHGLVSSPIYFSVLGWAADGNVADIDYEVTNLPLPRRFFGNSIVPVVRIIVESTVNTKDELPVNEFVSVYPNPVSDEIHVKMEFKNPNQGVRLKLINNLGQIVYTKTLTSTFTNHIESIKVSNLSPGNYMLQVETSEGQRSMPVIVVR